MKTKRNGIPGNKYRKQDEEKYSSFLAVGGREEKVSLTSDISVQSIVIEMVVIFLSRSGLIVL
jgi:hypothetical protein